MSLRATSDYTVNLQVIRESFEQPPKISKVILDFEKAVWNAFNSLMLNCTDFPSTLIK